jgi:hypothetical protein
VCFIDRKRRPSLAKLADMPGWPDGRRGRRLAPLAGRDWSSGWPDAAACAALAEAHVKDFWGKYDLDFPYRLEMKHAFSTGATWSKGHHAFVLKDVERFSNKGGGHKFAEGERYYRCRGASGGYERGDRRRHPQLELMDRIMDKDDRFPQRLRYLHKCLLTVTGWLHLQKTDGDPKLRGKRPGDEVKQWRLARFNNLHVPVGDVEKYKTRRDRRQVRRGKQVRLFEKYGAQGIASVHHHMMIDDLD